VCVCVCARPKLSAFENHQARPKSSWKAGFVYGIFGTSSSSKLQNMLYDAVEVKGNPVIYNKLSGHFAKTLFPAIAHRPSKLVCKDDQHRPKIPVHLWPEHLCAEAVRTFGKLGMHTAATPIVSYPAVMTWRGMQVVPYRLYRNYYVEFVEVVSQQRYDEQYGPSLSPLVQPFEYNIGGRLMCDTRRSFLVHGGESKTLLQLCTTAAATSATHTPATPAPPPAPTPTLTPAPLPPAGANGSPRVIATLPTAATAATLPRRASDVSPSGRPCSENAEPGRQGASAAPGGGRQAPAAVGGQATKHKSTIRINNNNNSTSAQAANTVSHSSRKRASPVDATATAMATAPTSRAPPPNVRKRLKLF